MVTASLCIALGLILPMVTAHGFGIPGNVLLPMHIPVLLCGLLCGPFYGALCGFVVPVLSSLFTNMPVLFPNLPVMAAQLLVMGSISGWFRQMKNKSVLLSVSTAASAGWITYGAVFYCLWFMGVPRSGTFVIITAIIRGIPGMAIQLLLLPLLVHRMEQAGTMETIKRIGGGSVMEEAKRLIQTKEATCVVIQGGVIVRTAEGPGISPLLRLFDEEPDVLRDAVVADKIIGKAAAMILVLAGARMVYGEVMSAAGLDYLHKHQVQAVYGRCVDVIHNRARNGICPIESSVLTSEDAVEGVRNIRRRVGELRRAAG